ncbi:MAG: PAS domain S-box protein [Dehalococcoidia bacterium]
MTVDHSVSDYTRETGLGWLKVIGLIPVPLFIGLIIAQAVVGSSAVFEPPYLLPALNILFLLIIPITVAVLCWLGYVHTGAVRILLIGCGMITLGFSSLAAGFAIDLPDGQNLVPIIHHTGALIASLFIIIASLLAVRYRPPHGPPAYGRSYAAAAYTCTLIIVALFIVAAFRGWIPPFFLPGSGFTILRMAVLGSAIALFALASILFLVSFARWSGFAYWYGLGLGLITIGLIAYLLTQAVGTPLGWTGRVAEYAGCVYMLIGIFSVARLSRLDGVPVADEMVESFSFSPASYNKLTKEHLAKLIQRYMDLFENSGTGIAIIDENGRFLMVNKRVAASFKKTVPEIIGLSLFDFLLRETAERYIELNRQLLLTGGRREYADTFVLPTGDRTFLMVGTCLKDENGKYFAIQHSSVDITEKKRVEEALAASEAKYRSLVETSSAGVASIDVEGNLTFVNTKMCEMTGYQVEELIGRPFKAFLAPEELDKVMDMFTDGLAHPERYTALEFKGIHKNGSILWLYTSPRQLVLNGKLAGFATVIFDITDRKNKEGALQESEEKYRALFESSPLGITITDSEGNIVEANKESERLLGLTRDAQLQRKYDGPEWQIVRPDGTPMPANEYPSVRALRENRLIENVEMGIVKSGNEITWINVTAAPIPLKNYGVAITYGDITQSKLAEEAILKSKILMQNVIDSTPDWIYVKDFQHKYMLVNKSFAQAQNMSPQDMVDRADTDFFSKELCLGNPDKDIIGYHADDNQAFQGHVVHNPRNIITWADGSQHTYDTYKFPLTDQSGKICGALVYSRDITQQSQAEEALQESENLYHSLFENMLNGFAYCRMLFEDGRGKDFVYIAVNSAFEKLTGLKNVTGKKISELIPGIWETDSELLEAYARVASTGIPETFEAYLAALNMWLYISVYSPEKEYFVAVFDVITDRKNMEIELQASHEEMRALAGNLQMAMESERKRVARMIHDDLAQTLTALQIELSGLTHKLPADHKQLSAQAAAMNRLITLMDERVKHITTELRPPLLDDLGLCAAVKLSLNEFSKRTGISHELHCDPEDFALDTDIAIALFRVLQESLTNVTRHAEADMVTVHLKKLQECISLQIKDNGKGIEKRELSNKKSIGIIGMRERVTFFGGKLRITSSPGGGTTIDVKIPLGQEVTP